MRILTEKQKEEARIRASLYYKKNKEECLRKRAEFREKNPECIKEQRQKFYKKNKEKINKETREYKLKNIEKEKEYQKQYREKNKQKNSEYSKQYRNNNRHVLREKKLLYQRVYRENNRHVFNTYNSMHRATKLNATPKWLTEFDLDYIRHLYIQAKQLEKLDGIKRHVDHCIPLRGKTVCGLHVPWNLQILTAEENMKKCNKLVINGII